MHAYRLTVPIWLVAALAMGLLVGAGCSIHTQQGGVAQELPGHLDLGSRAFHQPSDLRAVDTAYVHVSRMPGSLHTWLSLVDPAAGQVNKDINASGALWAFSQEYHLEGQPLGLPSEG